MYVISYIGISYLAIYSGSNIQQTQLIKRYLLLKIHVHILGLKFVDFQIFHFLTQTWHLHVEVIIYHEKNKIWNHKVFFFS